MEVNKEQMSKYHAMVKRLFDQNSEDLFPNSSKEHSAAIIEEILLHAKHDVKIFCTHLSSDVWDKERIRNAFLKAICRNVNIAIITQQDIDKTSELYKIIDSLDVDIKENIGSDVKCNFIVSDSKMFRFEENAEERRAIASANCKELAKNLDEFFANLSA